MECEKEMIEQAGMYYEDPVYTIQFSYENGTEMLSYEDGIM